MPRNKLASFRYRVINNCLKNTARKWTRIDLINAIDKQLFESFGIDKGISKRTFHYDIDLMRSLPPRGFDAPIVAKDGCYIYEDQDYSIDSIPLSDMDIESINNAVELLSQFKQLPIYSQLSLVKDKVTGQILTNNETEPIIELEYREVMGTEFLTPIYQSIKERRVIRIEYQSFHSAESKEFTLHPYFLKQYNHRWYLIAFSERFKNVGTYSLDRIHSIENECNISFDDGLNNSHALHFQDIIGVTLLPGMEPVEIVALIAPAQAPYIKTKPIHNSQKIIEENEKGLKIVLMLIPNYEFYSTLLGFGESITILSPEPIRNEIFHKLKSACQNYEV